MYAVQMAFVVMDENDKPVFIALFSIRAEKYALMMTVQRFKICIHPANQTMTFVFLNY
jgi:hypothetical protein